MDFSKLEVGIGPYMPSASIYCPFCGNYSGTGISGSFALIFGRLACNTCGDNFEQDRDSALVPVINKWRTRQNKIEEENQKLNGPT